MSISNIIDENDQLLVSQIDAETGNISGLLNVVDLMAVNDVTCDKLIAENVKSGIFTPGVTIVTNLDSIISQSILYQKIDDIVFCAFYAFIDPSNISSPVEFLIDDVPFPPSPPFSNDFDLHGSGVWDNAGDLKPVKVIIDAGNIKVSMTNSNAFPGPISLNFAYSVVL